MKKILFFFALFNISFADYSVVTYEFSGGRFGDNLLSYIHAKWFSYEHNLPFLYKPFPFSDSLLLHEKEIHYRDRLLRKKLKLTPFFKAPVKDFFSRLKFPFFSYCYICPYFPEDKMEILDGKFDSFEVNWKDKAFKTLLQELIYPKDDLNIVRPPKEKISIAIHVRDGGGFDCGFFRTELPLKFPPISFYINVLNQLIQELPNRAIYCHIFTDATDPEHILKQIQSGLASHEAIEFGYRTQTNRHDLNVLEDFFSLFEFDILIRPQSNFSLIPSLIKNYALVYSPIKYTSNIDTITISEFKTEKDQESYQRLFL